MSESNQGAGGVTPISDDDTLLDFVGTPPADEVEMLAEFGARLRSVPSQAELKLGQQIEIVGHADLGGRDLLHVLEQKFLALSQDADSPERMRVWEGAAEYLVHLSAAYLYLVRQFQTYSHGWSEVGDRIPLVVARALRTTSIRLKWQLMRYLPVETGSGRPWRSCGPMSRTRA
jgi:hypothetical protein